MLNDPALRTGTGNKIRALISGRMTKRTGVACVPEKMRGKKRSSQTSWVSTTLAMNTEINKNGGFTGATLWL